jgi:tRNA G18 (ribose-2'-O)-methylase SpoU
MEINIFVYNLRSVYNTASIFRTADASLGIKKIYLCGTTPAPKDKFGNFRSDFIKVSLGAEKNLLWESIKSLNQTLKKLEELKKEGYKILAIEQSKKAIAYWKAKKYLKNKIVLIVGNEKNGLPDSILKKADYILEIPMRGKLVKDKLHPKNLKNSKESLNVSVAFGIVLFNLIYN